MNPSKKQQLKDAIEDISNQRPGCPDKKCLACLRQARELREALELVDQLEEPQEHVTPEMLEIRKKNDRMGR